MFVFVPSELLMVNEMQKLHICYSKIRPEIRFLNNTYKHTQTQYIINFSLSQVFMS
jgi:hypothetical protein